MKVYAIAQNRENTDFDIAGSDVNAMSVPERAQLISRIQQIAPFDMVTPTKLTIKDGMLVGHFIPDVKAPDGRFRCALVMVSNADFSDETLKPQGTISIALKGTLEILLGNEVTNKRLEMVDEALSQCNNDRKKLFFRLCVSGAITIAAIVTLYFLFNR